jgi:hypothetical protein
MPQIGDGSRLLQRKLIGPDFGRGLRPPADLPRRTATSGDWSIFQPEDAFCRQRLGRKHGPHSPLPTPHSPLPTIVILKAVGYKGPCGLMNEHFCLAGRTPTKIHRHPASGKIATCRERPPPSSERRGGRSPQNVICQTLQYVGCPPSVG